MAWKAVHPDLTDETTPIEGGPTFTIGYFPPKVAAKLDVLRSRMRRPDESLDPVKDHARIIEESGLTTEAYLDMVRYGVRGWRGFGDIACKLEPETIDGLPHQRLTPESVLALHVNRLLVAVGIKAMLFNYMSEEERGKSDWRSAFSSPNQDTNAAGAAPASQKKTTESSPSS